MTLSRSISFLLTALVFAAQSVAQAQSPAPAPAPAPAVPATSSSSAPRPAPAVTAKNEMTIQAADTVRVLLIADGETTISSPVTARIKMLYVSIGLPFSTGQTLVSFDCEEPVARLGMAKAELSGAVETHEAKVRMQGLEQASDVEVALAASAAAKARAQVALQNAQVGQCSIKAPWAGRVAKVHVRTHMSVTPGLPMVDLVKSGPLRLKLNAPSRMISKVKVGTLFDVAIDETGKSYQARVLAVNSRVDPVSQTIEIESVITKNYEDLLPGMSGVALLKSFN
jgi:membrane fusion protein, multidrug efflux system